MRVLVTGSYGRCGTALIDHLADDSDYEFTYLDRSNPADGHPYGGFDTVVAEVGAEDDQGTIRDAMAGQDAIVHLAAYPHVESTWTDVHGPNVEGTNAVLSAASDAGVESVVFASTNHVQGAFEDEHAPALYEPDYGLELDQDDPVRPDSYYGTSKAFGEDLGRFFVENREFPRRFYALRICSVRAPPYDHPYGDAERAVAAGEAERGSPAYERKVARMKAMWHSRRDFAQLVDRCLQDDSVTFDVFNGVSDNDRRWFSIERARSVLGYESQDNAEEWDTPPTSG